MLRNGYYFTHSSQNISYITTNLSVLQIAITVSTASILMPLPAGVVSEKINKAFYAIDKSRTFNKTNQEPIYPSFIVKPSNITNVVSLLVLTRFYCLESPTKTPFLSLDRIISTSVCGRRSSPSSSCRTITSHHLQSMDQVTASFFQFVQWPIHNIYTAVTIIDAMAQSVDLNWFMRPAVYLSGKIYLTSTTETYIHRITYVLFDKKSTTENDKYRINYICCFTWNKGQNIITIRSPTFVFHEIWE